MNEIEVVVDVHSNPDKDELIVLKQTVALNGGVRLVGSPRETRVDFTLRKVQVSVVDSSEPNHPPVVRVKNTGTIPVEIDRIAFEFRVEEPRDFPPKAGKGDEQVGGSVELVCPDRGSAGRLHPGETRDCFFPADHVDVVALVVSSSPPFRYWVAVYSRGEEITRLSGELVPPFSRSPRISISARAQSLFDTMPELARLAVIRVVARLNGLEHDRWASAGAQELTEIPHTWLIRADGGLVVLLGAMEEKGIEIMDVVHQATLEQFTRSSKREDRGA